MKLAVYYDLPSGGALVHTLGFVEELKKHHQVELFTLTPPPVYHRIHRDLQAFFWSRHQAKELAREINQNFDAAYVTHDRFFQAPWILRYLKIPILFYCHNPTRAFFEKELGIDPTWPFINQNYERLIRFLKKNIEIKSAKYASQLATSSKYMVQYINNAYNLPSVLAYPGVNGHIFHRVEIKKTSQIILVGNNESQKSPQLALDSLALIPQTLRPTLVIISPRKKVGQEVTLRAKQLGIVLKLFSRLSPPEMNKLYNQSKLTLAVALREPFGLSIVESLAAGTPVVAVREGAFPETVRNGVDGVLTARNPESIAAGIKKVLQNEQQYKPVCKFSLEKSNSILLKFLSQLPKDRQQRI